MKRLPMAAVSLRGGRSLPAIAGVPLRRVLLADMGDGEITAGAVGLLWHGRQGVAPAIRVDFDGGTVAYLYMINDQDKQSMTKKVPKRPKNVVFAPDHSLLANIRRD